MSCIAEARCWVQSRGWPGQLPHGMLSICPASSFGFRCVLCHLSVSSLVACRWDPTRLLVDPYAPLVKGRAKFAQRDEFERFQTAVREPPMRW